METGVLQRDSRVWLHPKRRLACPLGRLPMKPNGARRRRRMDVPRRGTLLRSGQYDNCAKRYSVSSSEAKSRDLCLTRMRVNAQEENRKHGITCYTSSPLEKGRAEGAGWMCLEEAPFYAVVSMTTVQSATPYRQRKRSREIFAALVCDVTSRLRNESTVLHMIRVAPWRRRRIDVPRRGTLLRSGQYDNSAKRDFVSSFRAKREIFVIRGLAVNDWKIQT